jgi:alpha-L-fucosidase 2
LWARLGDGEKAYDNVIKLLTHSTADNFFDMHPPFQIDGNFGGVAGITEMLMQSHTGKIDELPALPKAWKKGYIKGLVGRGNESVSIEFNQQ